LPHGLRKESIWDFMRIMEDDPPYFVWQFFRAGYLRSSHEHRDHSHPAAKGLRYFHANKIDRIIEAATASLVRAAYPVSTDQRNECFALREAISNDLRKIRANLDGVDIHEDLVLSEIGANRIKQPQRVAAAIFSPVTNEYSGQCEKLINIIPTAR
jgi:hypothetical protein